MNWSERALKEKYESEGYDVIHTGIPDLILLKDGKIEFVEVKTDKDKLREHQKATLELLRKHGFEARVETIRALKISEKWIPAKEQKCIMTQLANNELMLGEIWNLISRSSADPSQKQFTEFLIAAFNATNAILDEKDPL